MLLTIMGWLIIFIAGACFGAILYHNRNHKYDIRFNRSSPEPYIPGCNPPIPDPDICPKCGWGSKYRSHFCNGSLAHDGL